MKRLLFLSLVLVLCLTACSEKVPAPQSADTPLPAEQTDIPPAEEPTAWPPADASAAADYLAGEWHCYMPSAFSDVMQIVFNADGSYSASVDGSAGMWGLDGGADAMTYTYSGGWTVEPFESETYPWLLKLSLSETNDPDFSGWNDLGDYLFREITLCDGELVIEFAQANNGDGLYTRWFMGETYWMLEREDSRSLAQTVQKNATFCAQLWKMQYEPQFCVFADDVTVDENGNVCNEVRESVRYEILSGVEGTSELSGGPDGLLSLGDAVYRLTTDGNGMIISAEYVPSGPAPGEEEAEQIIYNLEDARPYLDAGMSLMHEGTGQLNDGMYCAFVTLGTNHDDQFVREIRYAVGTDGFAYRYDTAADDWNWVS